MSDNLLVKTQGLLNLLSADIPREYALPIINLFSDSNAVVKAMQDKFGDQATQQNAGNKNNTNINDKTNNQNNKLNNVIENENQDN